MKTKKTDLGYELHSEDEEENMIINLIFQLMDNAKGISDDVYNENGCDFVDGKPLNWVTIPGAEYLVLPSGS